MRLLVWVSLVLIPAAAHGQGKPARYDHFTAKHATLECNDCHVRRASSAWGHVRFPRKHEPCIQSGCHAGDFREFTAKKPAFCRTCHLPGPGGHGIAVRDVVYPPYRTGEETQFGLASSGHGLHVEAGKCADCHRASKADGGRKMTFAGHEGCARCHGKEAKPRMSACAGCHVKREQSIALASSIPSDHRVDDRFSHEGHARKTRKNDCRSCHVNASVAKGVRTPLPSMPACIACHDGERAFDAVGSSCRRCHESSAVSNETPERAAFSHRAHADPSVVGPKGARACGECHPTDARGRLRFPASEKNGHAPCTECHAEQFFTRETKGICSVCHEHADPWRANPTKGRFRRERELISDLPHDAHRETACNECHPEEAGESKPPIGGELLAPGHEPCAECHESSKVQPMTGCDGCHRSTTADDVPSEWAVAEKFSHESHTRDVRTAKVTNAGALGWKRVDPKSAKKLDCALCHLQPDTAPNPKMETCSTCHDGKHAFKDTGFSCARCHGPIEEPR